MADSITLYEYDLAGRLVGTTLTSYDGYTTLANGRTNYNDGTGTVSSQYTTIYGDNGFADSEVEYKYTYYGLTTGVSPEAIYHYNANGAVYEYVYDSLGRVTERKTTVGASSDHTLTNDRLAHGFSESYDYVDITNNNNIIVSTTTLVRTYTDLLGVEHTYYYDANGNITMEVIVDGNNTEYKSYLYDSQNRMTRYNDSALDLTIVYTYDNRGNILNYTRYEYSAYTNPVNESTADSYDYAYANATWKDLATTIMGESITSDAIGNPLRWQGHKRLTWANGRQLTRARASTLGATFDVYYTYDGDGLRTGKSGTRNTEYIILGGTYIGERTTINGTEYLITYIYDANGSILGIDINGTAYYFVKNLQGDVTAMVTEFGEIIGKYTYDAYGYCYPVKDASGNTITDETHPAMLNPFRYRGYYYDVETKFYYLNTRYYDPEACRFINADGLTTTGVGFDGNNMFAYCRNEPVARIDIFGSADTNVEEQFDDDVEVAPTIPGGGGGGTSGTPIGTTGYGGQGPRTLTIAKGTNGIAGVPNTNNEPTDVHHIVEQCQVRKSGFAYVDIQGNRNLITIPRSLHHKISGYYSSKPEGYGQRVRDSLVGESFESQWQTGMDILESFWWDMYG